MAAAGLLLLGYGAAGMVGGAVAANADWTPPADGVRIYIESNGVHTDLVVPVVAAGIDWHDLARPAHLRNPRYAAYSHLAIGWGDRAFYLETPTWADVRPATVLAAAIGSDRTLVHVGHVPTPALNADVRVVTLRPDEYRRLARVLRASFKAGGAHLPGYGDYDAFYEGTGRYSAITTCNAWTGRALARAGVRIGAWTPFPVTVLGWFAP